MLTCDLLDQAVDAVKGTPSAIFMTKRSRRQLKTNAYTKGIMLSNTLDELGRPVKSWDGVPIHVSDAMIDTETAA